MPLRNFWVLFHRYIGLTMTLFLVIVGFTGSVLAFVQELDRWLNPELLTITERSFSHLDPFTLRERAEAQDPQLQFDYVPLNRQPADAAEFFGQARIDPTTKKEYELPYNEVFLDPYTGDKIGSRKWGLVALNKATILSFLYRLHYSLALPESTGSLGTYILGIVALLWSIDCFVGFYLTLPAKRNNKYVEPGGSNLTDPLSTAVRTKSWWQRWKPAWFIKYSRLSYDLHRAAGLWLWPMLFVYAWSSVAFNLNEVYSPVMRTLVGMHNSEELPTRDPTMEKPGLPWREAYVNGQRLFAEQSARHGFRIEKEVGLGLDRIHGVYRFVIQSNEEWSKTGATTLTFDANDGQFKSLDLPSMQDNGTVVTRWLGWLHMAAVFGLPMKIFVCIVGITIVGLSTTGVVLWWRKHRSAKHREARRLATKLNSISKPC